MVVSMGDEQVGTSSGVVESEAEVVENELGWLRSRQMWSTVRWL